MTRIALALLRGVPHFESPRLKDPTGATATRTFLFDEMFEPRYDEATLELAPERVRARRRGLPPWMQLALEVHRRRSEYDVVVTWGERLSLALMALQRFSRSAKPHIPMMYWFSKPNVRLPMRAFGRSLHAIVTWSSFQRRYAVERLGVPAERIYLVKHFVDQRFWTPRDCATDMISAAGKEMRDYPTLLESLEGTNLRCHIATDRVLVPGWFRNKSASTEGLVPAGMPNVSIGKMTSETEMRDLYARSRFTVVPVLPSDTDNGVTVILEAMAMGRPVICSRTRGQVDVIQEGITGVLVPPGDPAALRTELLSLWNDPERARAMGRKARTHVEEHHTLEKFCSDVRRAVVTSVSGTQPSVASGPRAHHVSAS